ncbi:MAG: PQQ-binding-like beta-propeller repeat protein [Candidatus Brocadiia bacterium]
MSLKGDLSSFSLSDVFKLITGKEGTLIVSDAESKKAIYFSRGGIKLLSTGARKGTRIGELLVKSGVITSEQLNQALNLQKSSYLRLGDVLTQLSFAKEEDINRLVKFQIEEEIYDIYNWKEANFEFIEGPPPPELADKNKQATEMQLDIDALMKEAARRLEEWKSIRQVLTSTKIIYALTEEAEEHVARADLSDIFKAIVPLINGLRTVDDIVEECPLVSAFEAYKAVYMLLTKGLISEVSFDKIKDNARQLLKQNKLEQALLLYSQAAKLKPEDFTINQNLAEVLEKLGRQSEAGEHYKQLGGLFEHKNMHSQAILAYQKALTYIPEDEEIHLKIFDRAILSKQNAEAIAVGKQLLKIYGKNKEAGKVASLSAKLFNIKAPDFEMRAYVSSAYFAMGEYEKSKLELNNAIKELPSQKPDVLMKAYEDVLKIEPNHSDAHYQRDHIRKQIFAVKRRRKLIIVAIVMLLIAGIAAAGFVAYDQYYVRQKFALLKTEVEKLKVQKLYHEAINRYQEFNYPVAITTSKLVRSEIAQIESLLSQSLQARLEAVKAEFNALNGLFKRGEDTELNKKDIEAALVLYKELLVKTEQKVQEIFADKLPQEQFPNYDSKKSEFMQLFSRTDKKIKDISIYLQGATTLFAQIQELDKTDKLNEMAKLTYQMINAYPLSPLTRDIKIPVKVESSPAGADVYLDGAKAGNTPVKIYLSPKGSAVLKLVKKGFGSFEKTIKAYEQVFINVQLEKTALWIFKTGGVIESAPLVYKDLVVTASRDGNVYGINREKGELKWKYKTDSSQEIISSPKNFNELIVFGCYDTIIYALKSSETNIGKLWSFKTSAAVKAPPFISLDNETVFVGSTDSNLYALSAKGQLLWKFSAGGKISNSGFADSDTVYIPCDDGNIYAVNAKTGLQKWKMSLTGKLTALVKYENNILVASNSNNCYCISIYDRQIKWSFKAKGPVASAPVVAGAIVYVTSIDKTLYALDVSNGKMKWVFPAKGGLNGSVEVSSDGVVYFGSEDGFIYAVNGENGQEIWKYKTNGKIRSTPVLYEDTIYIGTDDFSIYALEK